MHKMAADLLQIDEETGLATAGDVAGVAELRAGLAGDDGALVWSDPLPLTVVVAEAPVGLRVRVTDAATGQPLAGATVRAGEAEAATGDDGVAELPGADPEAPVSVFHPAHDYVTLVGVARRDLHVPLPRRSDPALVAGFSGEVDFDRVTSEGGVEVGLAGASISSGFTQLDIAALVGDIFESEVAVGGF